MRDDDMLDTPILFYGKSKLKIKKAKQYHSIVLKTLKSNNPFLYLQNGLLSNAPKDINEDYMYNFVFLGIYRTDSEYPKLYRRNSFSYKKIDI